MEPLSGRTRALPLAAAFYGALAAAGLLWMGWRGDSPATLLARGMAVDLAALLGVATGLAIVVLTDALLERAAWVSRLRQELESAFAPLSRGGALLLALLSGVAEEVFFRGALQPALGPVLSTALFGLLHTNLRRETWGWTAFALCGGALFALLFEVTGGLLAPVLAHATVNGLQLARLAARPPA